MLYFLLHARSPTIQLLLHLVVLLQCVKPEFLAFEGRFGTELVLQFFLQLYLLAFPLVDLLLDVLNLERVIKEGKRVLTS